MAIDIGSKLSPFVKKYLRYVGWHEDRNIDSNDVAEELKKWHWQGELPQIWYELCSSIDRLPPLVKSNGLPGHRAEEATSDGFLAYDTYFMASDGSNFAWISKELKERFGVNFGPLGLYHQAEV